MGSTAPCQLPEYATAYLSCVNYRTNVLFCLLAPQDLSCIRQQERCGVKTNRNRSDREYKSLFDVPSMRGVARLRDAAREAATV